MTIGDLLNRLKKVRKQGDGWIACCPAHDDKTPSLSINIGDDGRILMNDHAGCSVDRICDAIGISVSDLFHPLAGKQSDKIITATYDYCDENGNLLFQCVRFDPKDFRQRRPDVSGGWVWSLQGVRRVLYRLPELLAADPAQAVYLVEGEKDADRLRSYGLVATCNPMGAGKWRDEYAASLTGRHVVIIPDNDQPGREHAETEAQSLTGQVASLKVLNLIDQPAKGDVSDWLNRGNTVGLLRETAEKAPEWGSRAEPNDDLDDDETTGFFSSLQELHLKETQPADYVLVGVRRRQVTLFLSVTNVGKTTILLNHCLAAAACQRWDPLLPDAPERPLKVMYFDGESTDDELKIDTITMLKSIGGKENALVHFIPAVEPVVNGESLDLTHKGHFIFVKEMIEKHQPDIVVFDTVGALFTLFNENDNAEVKRKVIRPLKRLAKVGNCAILASHHIGKRGENTADEEESYLGRGASAFGTDTRAVFTLKREKSLGEGYVRLTLAKAKGVKFDPIVLRLDFDKRTFEICKSAATPKAETPYQNVIGLFNGQPLKRAQILELLPNYGKTTIDECLKRGVRIGELLDLGRGKYKKREVPEVPPPIGSGKSGTSTQPTDSAEDNLDYEPDDENSRPVNDRDHLLEESDCDETEILDAIDR